MAELDEEMDPAELAEELSPHVLAAYKRDHETGVDLLIHLAKKTRRDRRGPARAPGSTPTPQPLKDDEPSPPEPQDAAGEPVPMRGPSRAQRAIDALYAKPPKNSAAQ
jgi:hypothetical protein